MTKGCYAHAALMAAAGLLAACAAPPLREAPQPAEEAPVPTATWELLSAEISTLSVSAEEEAYTYAQAAVGQWFERVWARTDHEFIPWATDYWTHQWLALKLAWYRANSADDDGTAATARLTHYLQDEYRTQVVEPVAQEIDPLRIMDEATARYARTLAAGVRQLPDRYGVPQDQFDRWLTGIPAIAGPPGASLRDVVGAEDVTRLIGYQALIEGIRGTGDAASLAGDRAALRAVADRTAERLAVTVGVRSGATAASVLGGVPGMLLGLGISAWDATAYEQARPDLEANLRADLAGALRAVRWTLLEDRMHGVLAPVAHITAQLGTALPRKPAPLEASPLRELF